MKIKNRNEKKVFWLFALTWTTAWRNFVLLQTMFVLNVGLGVMCVRNVTRRCRWCWCDGWRCSTDLPINSYPLSSAFIHNAMGDEFCIFESVKSQLFARNAEAPPIHTRIHAEFKPPKPKEKRKSPSQTCSSLSISFHYLDGTHVNLNGKNILNGKICSCDKGILQIYRLGNGIKHII